MASSLLLLVVSVFILILLITNHISAAAAAQTNSNISLGTTLTPPSSWLSPLSDFAFGFHPLETTDPPGLFLLAIWFNKMENKTIIWTATANGQNHPVAAAAGSRLDLTSDGNLSLKDPTGQEIWNPGVTNISSASILDTGNFVLWNSDSTVKIWQTFDNPTDTILPGQVLNQGTQLYASLMDTDYSRGRFELAFQNDGNLVLYLIGYPTTVRYVSYWSSDTSGSGLGLVFNQTGSIYLSFQNNSVYRSITNVSPTAGDYYQRATLDPDGIFRQYSILKSELTTGSWEVLGKIDIDICTVITATDIGSGACGFNSYCTMDDKGRAECQCPPTYSFIDPTRKYKGCSPNFWPEESCEQVGNSLFDFASLHNVNWAFGDADHLNSMNESACRDNCLNDCLCAAVVFNANDGSCWKKKFPLSNGRTGEIAEALFKYSINANFQSSKNKADWKTWSIVAFFLLGTSVVLNLVILFFYLYRRFWRVIIPVSSGCIPGPALSSFTYKELEQATKGFSEEIGRGASSILYKGTLTIKPATITIAVKKLEHLSEEAEKDFTNEASAIGQTYHKNLVRLLGFCKEGTHRLLVFEFMTNGSLNKFLFGGNLPKWNQRVQIALGIAGGLAYLHEECRSQIIHCDIKPQNILLDENYVARISDFGLAKLLRIEQTRTSTGIRGTIGYFAPEWFKNAAITAKVDVYSFGVVLLEIICCRRNFEWGLESQEKVTLTDYAKECYRNGRLDLLVEEDTEAKMDLMTVERFVMVGISCVQEQPWLRPSMKKVVQMLEGVTSVSVPSSTYSNSLQSD